MGKRAQAVERTKPGAQQVSWTSTSKKSKKQTTTIVDESSSSAQHKFAQLSNTHKKPRLGPAPATLHSIPRLVEGDQIPETDPIPVLKKRKLTQNDYLREWIPRRSSHLAALYVHEAPPALLQCEHCNESYAEFQCLDCLGQHLLCRSCMRDQHENLIFHRINRWNGHYFAKSALWEVGVKLHLGHRGGKCTFSMDGVQGYGDTLQTPDGESGVRNSFTGNVLDHGGILGPGQSIGNQPPPNDIAGPHPTNTAGPACDPLTSGDADLPHADENSEEAYNRLREEFRQAGFTEDDMYEEDEDIDNIDLEEEILRSVPLGHPQLTPTPPYADSQGNRFVTIIDVSGVHHLPVVHCICHREDSQGQDEDIDFMELGLFPASFQRISTAFTFQLLDDFRIDNLECKVSAYHYFQKIRRITNPVFPISVPNRYIELRRLSRTWRNLRLQQQHGFSYHDHHTELGSQAYFCAACPQPGINMSPTWKDDPNKELFQGKLNTDGNFKSEHLKQMRTVDDVALTGHGEGFMTRDKELKQHLKDAQKASSRVQKVSAPTTKCHRHHAHEDSNKTMAGFDITGHIMTACARHGNFAPSSGTDMEKGERQMNVDWSFCEAMKTTGAQDLPSVCHIYDINCQYCVNFKLRVEHNKYLDFPDIPIDHAIGLFHVHGHQEECLYRYATTYIPGMAIVDGEIIETLWAPLNRIFKSMRTASIAQRREVFDDHKADSNWKKMLSIAQTICRKFKRATVEKEIAQTSFDELTHAAPETSVSSWKKEIEDAEQRRRSDVTAMDVMKNRLVKGLSKKELQVKLAEKELDENHTLGQSEWISFGLDLEEQQVMLRRFVRELGPNPILDNKLDLAKRRQKLRSQINKFTKSAEQFIPVDMLAKLTESNTTESPTVWQIDEDDIADIDDINYTPIRSRLDPECEYLPLPETLHALQIPIPNSQPLRQKEFVLRKGQAHDALKHIRESLSHLAWQFKSAVRNADTTRTSTRSWDGVHILNKQWRDYRLIYLGARNAILAFKNSGPVQKKFPDLHLHHCQISTVVSEPNARGQRDKKLSWIWNATVLQPGEDKPSNDDASDAYILEYYRLHWLRARATAARWSEEYLLTQYEMEWVVRYFMHQASKWAGFRETGNPNIVGLRQYAEKQVAMWNEMGRVSQINFKETNTKFTNIWTPVPHLL